MNKAILLVVPCFNEANRLKPNDFKCNDCDFLFVDDGSSDNTFSIISSIRDSYHLRLATNQGKAEAVRLGILHATKNYPQYQWIGFWDADLATPIKEIPFLISQRSIHESNAKILTGCRVMRLGSHIERSPLRHILGRFFTTVSSLLLKLPAYDTQCGAKLFASSHVKDLFSEPFVSKWVFDVEIFLRARKLNTEILEIPLRTWTDIDGSKLNIKKVAFRVLLDLWRIKQRYQA